MEIETYEYITNTLGLIGSLICLLLFGLIASRNLRFINRITFKLQAALALVDLLTHVIIALSWGDTSSDKYCSFLGFAGNFLMSAYNCIVFIISLNLHLNVLCVNKFKTRYVSYFWAAIIIFPAIHTVPLYALGKFGRDVHQACYIAEGSYEELIIVTNLIVPKIFVFTYCLVITILVLIETFKNDGVVDKMLHTHNITDENSKIILKKLLNNWILRITLYPIAYCLINTGSVVDFTLLIFKIMDPIMYYWSTSCYFLSGFINLIAFLIDPYLQGALISIFTKIWETTDCFGENFRFPCETPNYEMEAQSLKSKDSRASSWFNRTKSNLRRRNTIQEEENDTLLRDMTKDL